jgi:hypothetical protein
MVSYLALLALFIAGSTSATVNPADFSSNNIITRDVCIIGGGSSGTYATIRLQQMDKSVVLIEQKPTLGGHVNTFQDPVTGKSFDYGVISFDNIAVVNNYFNSFGLLLTPLSFQGGVQDFANFKDGMIVQLPASVPWTNQTAQGLALFAYGEQLAKYPFLVNGFDLPSPVPEDLLITYGDFLQKYNLEALADTAFTFIQGVGNILAQPTLYIMKYFAEITVQNILGTGGGFLTTANQDNQELYNKAQAKLGSDALVSSNVLWIGRDDDGVSVVVSTPSGKKLIKASELLIAIQPKLDSLNTLGMDLDPVEQHLFGQFNNSYYWDMVIRNSGIPDNISLNNVDPAATLALPPLPGLYGVDSSGLPGLHTAYYSSPFYISDEQVKADTLAAIARIVKANGYTAGNPEFAGFNNHAPFELTVSVDAIRDGFYSKLNALQGRRNTWWTGATWQAHDSSQIWNWTEYTLLPKLVASLK